MIDAQMVEEQLALGQAAHMRLAQLAAVGPPSQPVELPAPDQAIELLAQLNVLPQDIAPIIQTMPSPAANPLEWWLLERFYNELFCDIGGFDEMPPWPALPAERGPLTRL